MTRKGERCQQRASKNSLEKFGRPVCAAHTGRHRMWRPGPEDRAAGRQCTAKTTAGKRCLKWSMPGSDPPLCWNHAYPEKNPVLRHGYYRAVPAFSPEEWGLIAALTAEGRLLEAAILAARLRLRALIEYHQEPDRPLSEELNSFVLTFRALKAVEKLLLAQQALGAAEKPQQELAQEQARLAAALAGLEDHGGR